MLRKTFWYTGGNKERMEKKRYKELGNLMVLHNVVER